VSSPNEPGNGDAAPWERAATRRTKKPPPRRPETSPGPNATPGVEERINRFISGPAVTPQTPEFEPPASATSRTEVPPRADVPATTRTEAPLRSEAIRSELPDLSAPAERPPRPRPTINRQGVQAAAARPSRLQVGPRTTDALRVDPWSVLKVSLVLSVALFFVWMIAVAFLYLVLGGMGVWAKLNSNVGDLLNNTSSSELVSSGTIFGGAALVGLVNIVLLTAMATVAAFVYNLTTDLVGGIEVTLADRD
jgi:hypothetical protein